MKHKPTVMIMAAACLLVVGLGFSETEDMAEQAFQLRLEGQTDEALQLLEEAVDRQPGQARSWYELARTHFYLMDFQAVEKAIGQAVKAAPDKSAYHHFAGIAAAFSLIDAAHHQDRDRMMECGERAIAELEAAVKIDPENHDARFWLVQQLSVLDDELGLDSSSVEEHVRVLEGMDPVMGAKARSILIDEKQKRELWETILAEHGVNAQACYEAGEAFIDLGDLERASDCINKAIKLDPERTHILLRLANAYAMKNDLAKASVNAERYLGFKHPVPLRAWALGYLGRIRQRMGNADEGQKMVNQALALDPHLWKTFMPPPEMLFEAPVPDVR